MLVKPTRLVRFCVTVFAAAVCATAVSCGALSQPTPERAFFAIDPGEPTPIAASALAARPTAAAAMSASQAPTTTPAGAVLQVRRLRIASPYDGQQFVYRTKGNEYRSDYYNGFITAPDHLLTAGLIVWISRAGVGPYSAVVETASDIPARYVLDGNVTALYGDYTDNSASKAVITMKIFLLDDGGADARVVFQKEYNAAIPINAGSAESLVKGWSDGFRQILGQITADLNERSVIPR